MTKHPHRLILVDKKLWRCTLQGCNFFVWLGLAPILIGKVGICWECNEQFIIDERALEEEMPKCIECRDPLFEPVKDEIEIIEKGEEMTPARRKMLKDMGLLKD